MKDVDPDARRRCGALSGLGTVVFTVVIVVPCVGLAWRLVMDGRAPTDGWGFSARQWSLFGYTLMLSGVGTGLAMLLAWPAAAGISGGAGWLTRAGLTATLLIPPMVGCFGWQQLLNITTPTTAWANVATACIWALWLWPLPAMVLGAAWRRTGHEAYEAALTCCGPARAFLSVGLPAIRSAVMIALLMIFILLTAEYLVPHAWGLKVYATELLSWAISTDRAIDAAYPAVPLCACIMAGVALLRRRVRSGDPASSNLYGESVRPANRTAYRLTFFLVGVSCLVPVGGLIWRLGGIATLREVLIVHRHDLIGSLLVCGACAMTAVMMAAGLSIIRGKLCHVGWATLILGILPGAVIGTAITTTYGRWELTGDHWSKFVVGLTARFGWLSWLAAVVAMRGNRTIEEQAALDGAGPARIAWSIRLARCWPMLIASGLAVFALALSDLATTTQAQVSSFMPISLVLVDKMHKFEHGYVISLSLVLAVAALPGAAVAAWVSRRLNL